MFLTELALYSSSHRLRIEGGLVLYIRCNGALAPTLLLAVWLHTSALHRVHCSAVSQTWTSTCQR